MIVPGKIWKAIGVVSLNQNFGNGNVSSWFWFLRGFVRGRRKIKIFHTFVSHINLTGLSYVVTYLLRLHFPSSSSRIFQDLHLRGVVETLMDTWIKLCTQRLKFKWKLKLLSWVACGVLTAALMHAFDGKIWNRQVSQASQQIEFDEFNCFWNKSHATLSNLVNDLEMA